MTTQTDHRAPVHGWSPEDQRRVTRWLDQRHRDLSLVPTGCAVLAHLGWMIGFGLVTDVLEGTRFDIMRSLTGSWHGVVVLVMSGYGIATLLAVLVYRILRRRMIDRRVRAYRRICACLRCGYSMVGLKSDNGVAVCPECGWATRLDWWQPLVT